MFPKFKRWITLCWGKQYVSSILSVYWLDEDWWSRFIVWNSEATWGSQDWWISRKSRQVFEYQRNWGWRELCVGESRCFMTFLIYYTFLICTNNRWQLCFCWLLALSWCSVLKYMCSTGTEAWGEFPQNTAKHLCHSNENDCSGLIMPCFVIQTFYFGG